MKKLLIFILASLFCLGLFATPSIPIDKYDDDDYEPYIYMSNSGLNSYSLSATLIENKVRFSFINFSLITKENISISITFENEKTFNEYMKNFDLSDIENEFITLRKKIIKSNINPKIHQKSDDFDISEPFHTWYNCYCSKDLRLSSL